MCVSAAAPQTVREGTHARLEVNEDRARDIVLVVRLVEEHVLAVAALRRPVLEDALLVNPVLRAQSLPVLGARWRAHVRTRQKTREAGAHFGCRIGRAVALRSREAWGETAIARLRHARGCDGRGGSHFFTLLCFRSDGAWSPLLHGYAESSQAGNASDDYCSWAIKFSCEGYSLDRACIEQDAGCDPPLPCAAQAPGPPLSVVWTCISSPCWIWIDALSRVVTHGNERKALEEVEREIESLGGLPAYQRMSIAGQSTPRGGGSEKVLIGWLKELGLDATQGEKGKGKEGCKKLRSALSTLFWGRELML